LVIDGIILSVCFPRTGHVPRHVWLSIPFPRTSSTSMSPARAKDHGSLALEGCHCAPQLVRSPSCTQVKPRRAPLRRRRNCSPDSTGTADVYYSKSMSLRYSSIYLDGAAPRHDDVAPAERMRSSALVRRHRHVCQIQLVVRLSLSDLPCAARTTPRLPTWTTPATARRCSGSHVA
jgi:hypothetical protein